MEIRNYALIGFNRLVECARAAASGSSQEVLDGIEERIEYFKNSVIEYAGVIETGDEGYDLANAGSVLWEDGWCYPNDVFELIYEFAEDVSDDLGIPVEEIFYEEPLA